MKKKSICLILLFSVTALAETDLTLKTTSRSYPLSGSLNLEVGHGVLIWGKPKPWYGYARGFLEGATAVTYNSGTVGLELFPISFLGVTAGVEWAENADDYKAYDCETYTCQGKFRKEFVQANFGLAAGPVFAFARGTIEDHVHRAHLPSNFVEPASGLVARGEGDRMKSVVGGLGYEFNPTWRILYVGQYNQMREVPGDGRMHLINLAYSKGSWAAVLGGGIFDSTLKKRGATALLRLQWNIKSGLSLF